MRIILKLQTGNQVQAPTVDYVHSNWYSFSPRWVREGKVKQGISWMDSYYNSPAYASRFPSSSKYNVATNEEVPLADPRLMDYWSLGENFYSPPDDKYPNGVLAASINPVYEEYSYSYNNMDDSIDEAPIYAAAHERAHNWDARTGGDLFDPQHYPEDYLKLLNRSHQAPVTPAMSDWQWNEQLENLRHDINTPPAYTNENLYAPDWMGIPEWMTRVDPIYNLQGPLRVTNRKYESYEAKRLKAQNQANGHDSKLPEKHADTQEVFEALAAEGIIDPRLIDKNGKAIKITKEQIALLRRSKSAKALRALQTFNDEDLLEILNYSINK